MNLRSHNLFKMPGKTFAFTVKSYVKDFDDFFQMFEEEHAAIMGEIQYICYQEEQGEGDDEGRTHLQGMLQFDKPKRLGGAQNWFVVNGIRVPGYLKPAHDVNMLYRYVNKVKTRLPGGLAFEYGVFQGQGKKRSHDDEDSHKSNRVKVFQWLLDGNHRDMAYQEFGDVILGLNMNALENEARIVRVTKQKAAKKEKATKWWETKAYKWQREVKEILEKWHEEEEDRKILVILDRQGGAGKTMFGKMMVAEDPTKRAYQKKGKTMDMAYLIKNQSMLEYIIVDYTRDDEKYGSLKYLEMLKDGQVESHKYKPTQVPFDNLQVVVMTNKPIIWTGLSKDRWVVYEMDHSYVINGGEPEMYQWRQDQLEESWA